MLSFKGKTIYLACGATDMRKSFNGLTAIVQAQFQISPFSSTIFAFCNKSRDGIKLLEWDTNGFWLYYKRLEVGHFNWPKVGSTKEMSLTDDELELLLSSTKLDQKLRRKELNPTIAC
jgi:transposase